MTRETGCTSGLLLGLLWSICGQFCGQTSGADSFPVVSHFSVGGAQG